MIQSDQTFSIALRNSTLIHGSMIVLLLLMSYLNKIPHFSLQKETVDFEVVELPPNIPQAIEVKKFETKPIEIKAKTAVFGQSTQALTSESSTVATKAGNTLAKEPDDKVLDPNDDRSLPIPVAEYSVSSMPILMNEFKIPYPEEAKTKKIQGPVVLQLLIDDQGVVRKAELISGPGAGLNEAALVAVRKFKFRPARLDEKNVAVKTTYRYNFVLE